MFHTGGESEPEPKRAVSWWNVLIGLIIVFTAAGILAEAMRQLAPWYEAQSLFRTNPALGKVPSALSDKSMVQLTGFRVEIFGLAVQTPWNQVGTIRSSSDVAMIPFPEEHVVLTLFRPSSHDLGTRMFAEAAHGSRGGSAMSSYQLTSAELFTTPRDVKWWRSSAQNEARTYLLEMKSLQLGNLSDIYSVDFGSLRGFQDGNPDLPPYEVRLDLFDSSDRHYQIRIAPTGQNGPAISQAQINAMAASIHQIALD